MAARTIETDYLVIGAGAAGMAFADTLVTESSAEVVLVDRRPTPGGHWNEAYSFVRLHQPSAFYGVNSLPLGTDAVATEGPEAGWYPRSSGAEIRAYYREVLEGQLLPSGQVRYFPASELVEGNRIVPGDGGEPIEVRVRRRVVDGAYLSPSIPSESPPPFECADGARVVPVNALAEIDPNDRGYVIIGAGKTALDACVWLVQNGVHPEAIEWIKPRESWLLDREFTQSGEHLPTFLLGVALQMEAAAAAQSADDLFERLELAGQLHRVDRSVRPTMYRAGTIAVWELEILRRIDRVMRLGHVRRVERDRIVLDGGSVPTSPDHLIVHCAASGLARRPPLPIFGEGRITLQPVRVGLSPFAAALAAFVELHRDDDAERNRLCPPNPYPSVASDWIRGMLVQLAAEHAWGEEEDIVRWLETVRLNPTRGARARMHDPEIGEATGRFVEHVRPAIANLMRLAAEAAA